MEHSSSIEDIKRDLIKRIHRAVSAVLVCTHANVSGAYVVLFCADIWNPDEETKGP